MNIIWDFNGTILNDKKLCLALLNASLEIEGLPTKTMKQYRDVFMFPVQDYYQQAGFDFSKTSFDILAKRFSTWYTARFNENTLNPNIKFILNYFKNKGYKQYILSASRQTDLVHQVNSLGIASYFEELIGIKDIYAKSKVDEAIEFINRTKLNLKETIFIGDTAHDAEVAHQINVKSIIYTNGHMSKHRLKEYNTIDNFKELTKIA